MRRSAKKDDLKIETAEDIQLKISKLEKQIKEFNSQYDKESAPKNKKIKLEDDSNSSQNKKKAEKRLVDDSSLEHERKVFPGLSTFLMKQEHLGKLFFVWSTLNRFS